MGRMEKYRLSDLNRISIKRERKIEYRGLIYNRIFQ